MDRARFLDRIQIVLNGLPIVVICVLLVAMSAAVSVNVVARYVFSSGIVWADELARFSLIWITFLGAAVLVRTQEHIHVEIFQALFPKSFRTGAKILVYLIGFGIGLILAVQGLSQVERQWTQTAPLLGVSMGMIYTVIPITGMYFIAYSLKNIITIIGITKTDDREGTR